MDGPLFDDDSVRRPFWQNSGPPASDDIGLQPWVRRDYQGLKVVDAYDAAPVLSRVYAFSVASIVKENRTNNN
jgi:hypothetical protein